VLVRRRYDASQSAGPGWPEPGDGTKIAVAARIDEAAGSTAVATPRIERLLTAKGWPLAGLLAIQAALSLHLVWKTTAFLDEALYLSIGHLELAHALHGAAMPEVAGYLSGSPLLYPPLAAAADSIGGLAAARVLSLLCMLLVTFLLHGTCRRLTGSRTAAFFAAALFAGLGPTQYLGALATYDAMALALLALATWLGVRAAEPGGRVSYVLMGAAGLSLLLADTAKYAAALFDPVVVAVVVLAHWRWRGRADTLRAGGAMIAVAALPGVAVYLLAGPAFRQGVLTTTADRAAGPDSVSSVLALSAHATGVIAVLAVLGAVVRTVRPGPWPALAAAWALAAAEFLVPAEQARIHTVTSLYKHVDYGAWFACVLAGYLLAEWPGGRRRPASSECRPAITPATPAVAPATPAVAERRSQAVVLGVAIAVLAGIFSAKTIGTEYGGWPNSRPVIAALSRLLRPAGYYLVEDSSLVTYYLRSDIQFTHVDSTFGFSYTNPQTRQLLTGGRAYTAAIGQGYFAAVVLRFGATAALDRTLVRTMVADHDYRLAELVRYRTSYGPGAYQIWVKVPAGAQRRMGGPG
jgi:4-amino-4-deoxy-L-arabinose transferase-like glycosyltransferase